jgi:uncharacterized protein YbaR (Trm112 family)
MALIEVMMCPNDDQVLNSWKKEEREKQNA